MFDRDFIINRLQARQADLQAAGLRHLSLFGSVSRGVHHEESDIDFAAEYENGLDLFDRGAIASDIAEYIGTDNFDLADRTRLKSSMRERFENEHIQIF